MGPMPWSFITPIASRLSIIVALHSLQVADNTIPMSVARSQPSFQRSYSRRTRAHLGSAHPIVAPTVFNLPMAPSIPATTPLLARVTSLWTQAQPSHGGVIIRLHHMAGAFAVGQFHPRCHRRCRLRQHRHRHHLTHQVTAHTASQMRKCAVHRPAGSAAAMAAAIFRAVQATVAKTRSAPMGMNAHRGRIQAVLCPGITRHCSSGLNHTFAEPLV